MTDLKKEIEQVSTAQSFEAKEAVVEVSENKESQPESEKAAPEQSTAAEQVRKPNLPKRHFGVVPVRDPVAQKIEKILEENVGDAYSRLSPIAKQEFKMKGEVTARKIAELLKGTHIQVKKIFHLILEWLKMLPGVNRFFLEQEAKIKTDRIIALHNRKQ